MGIISQYEVFALVHLDYEGLQILELGEKAFILNKFMWWKEKLGILQEGMNQGDPSEDLCIQGYDGNTVGCVCDNFDITVKKVKGF